MTATEERQLQAGTARHAPVGVAAARAARGHRPAGQGRPPAARGGRRRHARPGRHRRRDEPGAARQPAVGRSACRSRRHRRTRRRVRQRHRGRAPVAARGPEHRRPGVPMPARHRPQRHRRRPGVPRPGKRGLHGPRPGRPWGGLRVHPAARPRRRGHRERRPERPGGHRERLRVPLPPGRLLLLAGRATPDHPGQALPGLVCRRLRAHADHAGREHADRRPMDQYLHRHGTDGVGHRGLGHPPGSQGWIIKVQFGPGGDCYEFDGQNSLGSTQMGYCGPVSTPAGPETIMALPLGFGEPGAGASGTPSRSARAPPASGPCSTTARPCWPRRGSWTAGSMWRSSSPHPFPAPPDLARRRRPSHGQHDRRAAVRIHPVPALSLGLRAFSD